MSTWNSRTLSVTIDRPWQAVYDFAADPANMTQWAAGLGNDFAPEGDFWIARDPGGNPIRIRFTPHNSLGVLDHDVHTPGGVVVHVAMRVMPNGTGSEVTFLLLQERGMTDAEMERDAEAVQKDLDTLKRLMEA